MIFKLIFDDKKEYAQARNQLDLLQQYCEEYGGIDDIKEVIEISAKEAKKIILSNGEYNPNLPIDEESNYNEYSLYDAVSGEDFVIIGSTYWD